MTTKKSLVSVGSTVRTVSADELHSHAELQPRLAESPALQEAAIQSLAATIKQDGGIRSPILAVTVDGADGYQIVNGHRRYAAGLLAGITEFPVVVLTRCKTWEDAADLAACESAMQSATTEKLSAKELLVAIRALRRQNPKINQTQIGERLGLAQETISKIDRLARAPVEALRAAHRGDVSESAIKSIIHRVPDPTTNIVETKEAVILPDDLRKAVSIASLQAKVDENSGETIPVTIAAFQKIVDQVIGERPKDAVKEAGVVVKVKTKTKAEKERDALKARFENSPTLATLADFLEEGLARLGKGQYKSLTAKQAIRDVLDFVYNGSAEIAWLDSDESAVPPAKDGVEKK